MRRINQRLEDHSERLLELLDVTAHEQEIPLDLLDRVTLRHHLFHADELA